MENSQDPRRWWDFWNRPSEKKCDSVMLRIPCCVFFSLRDWFRCLFPVSHQRTLRCFPFPLILPPPSDFRSFHLCQHHLWRYETEVELEAIAQQGQMSQFRTHHLDVLFFRSWQRRDSMCCISPSSPALKTAWIQQEKTLLRFWTLKSSKIDIVSFCRHFIGMFSSLLQQIWNAVPKEN